VGTLSLRVLRFSAPSAASEQGRVDHRPSLYELVKLSRRKRYFSADGAVPDQDETDAFILNMPAQRLLAHAEPLGSFAQIDQHLGLSPAHTARYLIFR
jgi:hypothetical protein